MSLLQARIDRAVVIAFSWAEDRVTFTRPTVTTDTSGGHTSTSANTTPVSIPCMYRPTTRHEKDLLGEMPVKGSLYALFVPAQYGSDIVDVDSSCTAVVAARGIEGAKTFHVHRIDRAAGAVIKLWVSIAE